MSPVQWVSLFFSGVVFGLSIYILLSMIKHRRVDTSLKHYEAYSTMMRASMQMLSDASETGDPLEMARALHASLWLKEYADQYGRENGLPIDEWERAGAE
jgi:hypothetical protein